MLAPTWAGLQSLLYILGSYSVCLDVSINIKKIMRYLGYIIDNSASDSFTEKLEGQGHKYQGQG